MRQLENELRITRAQLTDTLEHLETSNSDLTSANEELQSPNEELSSSNEELQTSQEELRSINEGLDTVNTELKRRVEELGIANSDLFSSTDAAMLFVDTGLRLRRFTHAAGRIFHFIDSDLGRPLSDFAMI